MNMVLRKIGRFFAKKLPHLAYPVFRGPLRGSRFILGALAGKGGGASVYFNMIEIEQTEAFINALRTGNILFDVGANVGYYTILGSRLVGPEGKVIAVEPVIRNLIHLYKHTLLNKANNVSIIPAACSDNLSLASFLNGENFATGRLANRRGEGNSWDRASILVPTVTIDAIAQQLQANPDVIKVDVEGAELSVLKGAQVTLQKAKPHVFLSTHSEVLRTNCLEYLTGLGYTIEVLSQDKENPSEFLAK